MTLFSNTDRRGFMAHAFAGSAATILLSAPVRAAATAASDFGPLKHVRTSLLDIAYAEVGPAGFAKDGKPSAKSAASWPAYRSGSRDMLVLKPPRPFAAPAGYTGDRQCAMWDKLSN